jgi:uncharacterized SAM-binding protein YcdF (DUF218 family)
MFSKYSDSALAQIIWDFDVSLDQVEKAGVILVLGSHDIRVAHRGIELLKSGFAPTIIFSGGFGRLTHDTWKKSEAETFADEARKAGVSENQIIIEDHSTNTGENIAFTSKLLQERNINPHSFIVVQKPYMLRRTLATFKKQLPEKELFVTAPQLGFTEYPNEQISQDEVIHIMVGDLQRLMLYPAKGFQIKVEIPKTVLNAYEELVKKGYTKQLLKE